MPPQHLRRSACLQTLSQSLRMSSTTQKAKRRASAKPSGNAQPIPKPAGRTGTQGKGKGRAQEATGPLPATSSKSSTPRPPNITWDENRVQELVSWLVTCLADRHVLYHDCNQAGSAPPLPSNEQPSGRQKKDIHAVIAKHIFGGKDPEYLNSLERYVMSVSNRLTAYVTHNPFISPVLIFCWI